MTYEEALKTLHSLGPELRTGKAAGTAAEKIAPRKFSLDHIRTLLGGLGDPQTSFRSVLIAGTNGKGSTAALLAAILAASGLRTGLYTSPHLVRVNERIRVTPEKETPAAGTVMQEDGHLVEIGDAGFGRHFGQAYTVAQTLVERGELPHTPSFFELLTATAFLFFAEQGVELAVLEVGLGGRLDATNVVEPILSVITDIGIDHTEFLGSTLSEIAAEKAGILRPGGVLVTLSQHPEANAAIGERAITLGVRGVDASRCLPPRGFAVERGQSPSSPLTQNSYTISVEGEALQLDSPLAGHHQQRNLALAVATALELRASHGYTIPNAAIEAGVRATVWPGRLEWLADPAGEHAPLLLDVAHNPAGAWALRAALGQLEEKRPRTLLFSCLADKQLEEMARILFPLFDPASGDPARVGDHVLLAPIENPRAASVQDLLAVAQVLDVPAHAAPHLEAAWAQARQLTPRDGVIVATGSVYLVGALRVLALRDGDEAPR